MFTKKPAGEPEQLSAEQALDYWKHAAITLRSMLGQIDATTPSTEQFSGMLDDLRDAATGHLIAANALVGHYTMLVGDQAKHAPGPPSTAGSPPADGEQPGPTVGWTPPPAASGQTFVPPARQAAMPGYPQRQPQPNGSW